MFKVTRQTLDLMERRDELTVSDVGGLLRDLFHDILEEQHVEFSDLPAGDPAEAAGAVVMVMQQMRKLHRKNDEIFSQERYRERWENAVRGLDEAQRELESILKEEEGHGEIARKLREVQEKTEDARLALAGRKAEQKQAEDELAALRNEERELEDLIGEKKKECARCAQETIPEKEKELERLRQELAGRQQELAQTKQACEKLQEQLREQVEELTELRNLWDRVTRAYARDEELFPAGDGKDADPAGSLNERYLKIREELEAFRRDYARAADILRRV